MIGPVMLAVQAALAAAVFAMGWRLFRSGGLFVRFAALHLVASGLVLVAGLAHIWLTVPGVLVGLAGLVPAVVIAAIGRDWRAAVAMTALLAALIALPFVRPFAIDEALFKLLEPDAAPPKLLPAKTIARFDGDPPALYESIEAMPDGSFFVTNAIVGEVVQVTPDGTARVVARLLTGPFDRRTFNGMISTLVRGRDGALYVVVLARDPANRGIWRVTPDGDTKFWARLPETAQPNGITTDANGDFYVADSRLGAIWKIAADGGEPRIWFQDELVGAGSRIPLPSANGVKLFGNQLYVSVSSGRRIVRVLIEPDGSAGPVEAFADGMTGDDFAIDQNGSLYVTTHPFNTVVRIAQNGARHVVATADQGVVGPTSAVFGVTPADETSLYVLADGGFSRPMEGAVPAIVKLEAGVAGWQGFRAATPTASPVPKAPTSEETVP